MINFREIFNMSYSYIGIIIIGIIMIMIILLDKKEGIRIIGRSFLGAGGVLIISYLLGNMLISSFEYKIFVVVISDNFFNSLIIFSVVSLILGGISFGFYRYVA